MGAFEEFALVPEQGVQPEMAQLPPEMQETIRQMAGRLRVSEPSAVAAFGAKAQKDMSTFSEIALRQMLSNDIDPLGGIMQTLGEQIRACSFKQKAQGLFGRMMGTTASLAQVRSAYEKAEPHINDCANKMTDRRVALMRDSALLDRLYERNETLYRELCSLIVIGEEAQRQAAEAGLPETDQARLDRRLQDLRVTRIASSQMAAQIRLVQENDRMTCERMQTALEVTIPLWKGQMATALGLARAAESLRMEQRTTREAMKGIRQGTQELERQRAAYVKAAETPQDQAEETAEKLLLELDEIENSLKEQAQLRGSSGM